MKKENFIKICFVLLILGFGIVFVNGQSTNIDYPTPIGSSEIKGKIKARDIGDPRLTSHFYVFDGNQGDIFISIESNNLEGDIDIFLANGLKPLTKISLFAESTPTKTGREIYLRKSERMILRIEGRTPNDDEATYLIKFTGSFQTVAKGTVKEEPKSPEIKGETEGEVKVNSVGTIIETKTEKPTTTKAPIGKQTAKATTTTPKPVSTVRQKETTTAKKSTQPKTEKKSEAETETKSEVVITNNLPKTTEEKNKTESAVTEPKNTTAKNNSGKGNSAAKKPVTTKSTKSSSTKPATKAINTQNEELAKALENVKLVVLFKDGAKVEHSMPDVLRFGVDKGILTIVTKDGSIGRYSIIEITKISVE